MSTRTRWGAPTTVYLHGRRNHHRLKLDTQEGASVVPGHPDIKRRSRRRKTRNRRLESDNLVSITCSAKYVIDAKGRGLLLEPFQLRPFVLEPTELLRPIGFDGGRRRLLRAVRSKVLGVSSPEPTQQLRHGPLGEGVASFTGQQSEKGPRIWVGDSDLSSCFNASNHDEHFCKRCGPVTNPELCEEKEKQESSLNVSASDDDWLNDVASKLDHPPTTAEEMQNLLNLSRLLQFFSSIQSYFLTLFPKPELVWEIINQIKDQWTVQRKTSLMLFHQLWKRIRRKREWKERGEGTERERRYFFGRTEGAFLAPTTMRRSRFSPENESRSTGDLHNATLRDRDGRKNHPTDFPSHLLRFTPTLRQRLDQGDDLMPSMRLRRRFRKR